MISLCCAVAACKPFVPQETSDSARPHTEEANLFDCAAMKQRRIRFLTGVDAGDEPFLDTAAVRKFIVDQDASVENTLYYFGGYEGLKAYTPAGKEIEEVYADFNRVLVLAKVYGTERSRFFHSRELAAAVNTLLTILHKVVYHVGQSEHTNWWHWEIGFPLKILDTLLLLDEAVDPALRQMLIAATRYFQPDALYSGNNPKAIHPSGNPKRLSTGANRVDLVKLCVLRGILAGETEEIRTAFAALETVWHTRTGNEVGEDRDGFYTDGSFIQHEDIPYTGTYGAVLIGGIGELLYLTGSKPVVRDYALYERLFAAFEPLLYKGCMPDFVSGRAISRKNSFDRVNGQIILNALAILAKSAPEPYSNRIVALLKRELVNRGVLSGEEDSAIPLFCRAAQAHYAAATVEALSYLPHLYCFNAMERYFFRSQKYAIALALHSKRIGNYESFNGENIRGWYTGDGMIYIYDRTDNYRYFWHEADLQYIPGTTEVRQDMEGKNAQRKGSNPATGSPSTGSSETKTVRMDFYNWNDTLRSSKTWTFIRDGLHYTETDITATGAVGEVYHVVEHKQVFNTEQITVNGAAFLFTEQEHSIPALQSFSVDGRRYALKIPKPARIRCYRKNGRAYCIVFVTIGFNPTGESVEWTCTIP